MAITYREFDTTQANLVADLKTNILLNTTDYTNPTGNVVQATTTRGATIAVDLSGYGLANTNIQPKPWRLFSGGVGTDAAPQKWIYWNSSSAGGTTEPLHCRIAAGKEFLYVDIEGARAGETLADSSTKGSARSYFAIADIVPYMAADTTPAVCYVGGGQTGATNQSNTGNGSHFIYVSRNQANAVSWVSGKLWTLRNAAYDQTWGGESYQPIGSDGNQYAFPYVVMEDIAGIRGRLNSIMFCGWNYQADGADNVPPAAAGGTFTYSGNTYKILAPSKGAGLNNNKNLWGPFGETANDSTNWQIRSPLIAVAIA